MNHLFVTGFPRSGTSLIMDFLQRLGYDVGGSWNKEISAGWEDEQFQKIVTTMLMNSQTEDLILFLEKEIVKIDKIIVKHPRLLLVPNLLKIWLNVKPNLSGLILYREPLHALLSKKSLGNLGYYTNFSSAELDKKFHEFISQLIHLRIQHKILYFPNFIENYDEVYHSISSLGIHIDKDRGRYIWHSIADPNLVHFK